MEQFEQAARLKLRFDSPQGSLTTEDLWGLPLTTERPNKASLNDIAKGIARQLKAEGEEDFVNPKSGADERLQLMLNIVKRVIEVKQAENAAAKEWADKRDRKAKIVEIMERKQDQALEGKSLDELQAELAAL
jgi:hypothetical protein